MNKGFWTALILAACCYTASHAQNGQFEALPEYPFVYVSSDSTALLPLVSDSLFNASAEGIRFVVNRSELRPTEPFVDVYKNKIVPLLLDKGLVLRRIVIRGAASPEGPYANNLRLAKERTQRLVDFINSELPSDISSSKTQTGMVCEDYEYLSVLMTEAHDADAGAVSRIWQQSGGDEQQCKKALMALQGGKVWKRLVRDYFPRLRQARVMMWFGKPQVAIQFERVPLVKVPTDSIPQIAPVDVPYEQPKAERLPLLAVRTNLLHDFFYMPNFGFALSGNIQLEYFPRHGHLTYNAGFTFSNHRHWQDYKFFQIRDVQLEVRRYFKKGHPYRGAFLGAYAHGFCYGIGFNENKGWEGEGGGAGISGGYTFRLDRKGHLRMELTAALGFLLTRYDPYVYGNPISGDKDGKYYYDYSGAASKFKKRNWQYTWLGPTNVGIQLTYDLIYRKAKKGGEL